jgi:thioester reductase-like protein
VKRKILVTGATGVVGSAVVPKLAADPEMEVHLLVRARDPVHLEKRKQELCTYWQADRSFWISDANIRRLQFHSGDVTESGLGLIEREYQSLSLGLTNILHSAANVKLDMSWSESLQQSVGATKRILELQRNSSGCKLDYVSTVGVKGKSPIALTESRVLERRPFYNTYEAGKFEAENLLYQAQDQEQLKITIHRPSMVLGHSETGKIIHFQVFYFLLNLISGKLTRGYLPDLSKVKIDTVPNDKVAELLYQSILREESVGKIYHHCAGFSDAPTVLQLRKWHQEQSREFGNQLPTLRRLPREVFAASRWIAPFLVFSPKWQTRMKLFPQFLDYASQDQIFSNDQTLRVLQSWQVDWPRPNQYLPIAIEYYLRQ